MISSFKKLRRKLIINRKTKSYLGYAIGEILLIVTGILIALQINIWNINRMNKKQELKIYQNLKSQINEDLNELQKVKDYNSYYLTNFEKANTYITNNNRQAIDTLAFFTMTLSQFSDFHRSANVYETLVNSGDIKIMKNDSITRKLQKLETTYNFINRLEDIHWELIINELPTELKGILNYTTFEIIKPDKFYSVEVQNLFFEFINLMKIKDETYSLAILDLKNLVRIIDEELAASE